LQAWLEEMAAYTKAQAPNHLVTVGSEGFFARGSPWEAANPAAWAADMGVCVALDAVAGTERSRRRACIRRRARSLLALPGRAGQGRLLTSAGHRRMRPRAGQDFSRNNGVQGIDFATLHVWPDNWDT
jgi:endo-1,4-beta-mannosidase